MSDLIDRQTVINALENTDCDLTESDWNELTDTVMRVPSARTRREPGRWANLDEYVKHVEEITGHEQHITYHDDSVYCGQCWSRRNGNWDYCPYCGSYNGGMK